MQFDIGRLVTSFTLFVYYVVLLPFYIPKEAKCPVCIRRKPCLCMADIYDSWIGMLLVHCFD